MFRIKLFLLLTVFSFSIAHSQESYNLFVTTEIHSDRMHYKKFRCQITFDSSGLVKTWIKEGLSKSDEWDLLNQGTVSVSGKETIISSRRSKNATYKVISFRTDGNRIEFQNANYKVLEWYPKTNSLTLLGNKKVDNMDFYYSDSTFVLQSGTLTRKYFFSSGKLTKISLGPDGFDQPELTIVDFGSSIVIESLDEVAEYLTTISGKLKISSPQIGALNTIILSDILDNELFPVLFRGKNE